MVSSNGGRSRNGVCSRSVDNSKNGYSLEVVAAEMVAVAEVVTTKVVVVA